MYNFNITFNKEASQRLYFRFHPTFPPLSQRARTERGAAPRTKAVNQLLIIRLAKIEENLKPYFEGRKATFLVFCGVSWWIVVRVLVYRGEP